MEYEDAVHGLISDAQRAASIVRAAKDVLIVSHIDADGISSAAIATRTCERLGMRIKNVFAKKMDEATIQLINNSKESLVWITDLGSGYISQFERDGIVITDHHVPDTRRKTGQLTFDSFVIPEHVNPHTKGLDGTTEASGSSMTYLVSKYVDLRNVDLAYLAVIGSCGDLQDMNGFRLSGINTLVVDDAVKNGDVVVKKDIRLFGKESRSVLQMLQYCTEPVLPGLSENRNACMDLLDRLGIPQRGVGGYRCWVDLSDSEKELIIDELGKIVPKEKFMGDVYYLPGFSKIRGLGEAKEFATGLNSCGRYDDCVTGLKMCFGDRDSIEAAKDRRSDHRKNIADAITYVKSNNLVKRRQFIQYFNADDKIQETVVGIVAGMLLRDVGDDLPIFAFARSDDGIKVSGRADQSFIGRGLDLSKVMAVAAENVGGFGGGHNVAAGASIPEGKEEEFLNIAEAMVASQVR